MKKLLLMTIAFTTISGAAFADADDGSLVTRGTSGVVLAPGVPAVMPFVSDRTYRRETNFRPGPFHELGPDNKVEWRR